MNKKDKIKQLKNNKGITLIALVITIIVLIILAGISINLLLGDNGIITKAKQAKGAQEEAELQEKIEMLLAEYAMEREFNNKTLVEFLQEKSTSEEIGKVTDNGDGTVKIELGEYAVTINKDKLSVTEMKILDVTTVDYEIKGFENGKINIVVTVENLKSGIAKVIKPDGQEIQGENKKQIIIDCQIENNIDNEFQIVLSTGAIEKQIIKYADTQGANATIELSKKTIFNSGKLTANVIKSDEESGVNIDECKWVISKQSGNLGTDTSLYTGGKFTQLNQSIEIASITEAGEYYIHVLTKDNVGNLREIISEKITKKNGYEIATAEDFQAMGDDLAGNYYVTQDINMTNYNFKMISGTFTGTIDGQGHTITGLKIENDKSYTGIFEKIKNVTIKNILFKDVNVSSTNRYIGLIARWIVEW